MEIKKYFFVIPLLCLIVSDQRLFCSQRSETDEDPSMTQIFGNCAESVSENFKIKELLFEQYRQFLTDLDHETFDEVFTYFIDRGKQCEIECGALFDTCSILTKFGHALQKAVALKKEKELAGEHFFILLISDLDPDTIALYQRYQKLLGNFDEDIFIQAINLMEQQGAKEKIVDACRKDIDKIDSDFGSCIKHIVLIRRRKAVLAELQLEYKNNLKMFPVIQALAQELEVNKWADSLNFIPELLTLACRHHDAMFREASISLDDKKHDIVCYYGLLKNCFIQIVREKKFQVFDSQQYIKSFIVAVNAYVGDKGMKKIIHTPARALQRSLTNLFETELSKTNQRQRLNSANVKKTTSNNRSPAVAAVAQELPSTDIFEKSAELITRQEERMRAFSTEEETAFQLILEQGQIGFQQAQKKEQQVLTDQTDKTFGQIEAEERQGFLKLAATCLQACRNIGVTRLNQIRDRFLCVLSERKYRNRLEIESIDAFELLENKESDLRSLTLELEQEIGKRDSIDKEFESSFKQLNDERLLSFNKALKADRYNFGYQTSVASQEIKKERLREFSNLCVSFLNEVSNLLGNESRTSLTELKKQKLKEQALQRAIAGYRHNPYSSHIFQEEKKMHFFLKELYFFFKLKPERCDVIDSNSSLSDSDQDNIVSLINLTWEPGPDYKYAQLENGSLYCWYSKKKSCFAYDNSDFFEKRTNCDPLKIVGKVLSNGKTFVWDDITKIWRPLCIESAL